AGEICRTADLFQGRIVREMMPDRYRVCRLTLARQPLDGLVDAAVERFKEMLRAEMMGNQRIGVAVDEKRAKQCLLDLDVVWPQGGPICRAFRYVDWPRHDPSLVLRWRFKPTDAGIF